MIIVHIGHKEHTGQTMLLAELPGLHGTRLDAGLAVHHDNGRIRCGYRLLCLTHKIKVARRVQNIDLQLTVLTLVLQRNHGSGNGKLSLLLFLVIVGNGVTLGYGAHARCRAGCICQCLCYGCLSCAAVSQKYHIAYVSGAVNLHMSVLLLYWASFVLFIR